MSSSRLDLSERYRLHALYETGMSMRAIADVLARAPSTISRELRRNQHAARYQPDHAQRISAHRRTQASRRPRIRAERIGQIEVLLREDVSPEQIAGRTGLASHAWIYRHIDADQKRGGQLFMHLRKRRRKRRRRGVRDGRGQLQRATHGRSALMGDASSSPLVATGHACRRSLHRTVRDWIALRLRATCKPQPTLRYVCAACGSSCSEAEQRVARRLWARRRQTRGCARRFASGQRLRQQAIYQAPAQTQKNPAEARFFTIYRESWCPGEDSNLHEVAPAST